MDHTNSKRRSIGSPGELLVVIDDELQKSEIKSIIADFADEEFPCIPQWEPTFKMVTISPNEFEGYFKLYRNIIIVRQTRFPVEKIEYLHNVWANHQQVMKLNICEVKSFGSLFSTNKSQIYNFLYYGDIVAMQKANLKAENTIAKQFLNDKYGVDMVLPKDFRLIKDTLDFSWFRFDKYETTQNIVMYSFNVNKVNLLDVKCLVRLRDSICRTYISGPFLNSYMTTEKSLPIRYNELIINNTKVIEIRGLWKVEGYFMGGPFVDYFVRDSKNQKLIWIEGFAYAPRKQNKSFYVRQIESILHSVSCS